jgi:hypothetical protein
MNTDKSGNTDAKCKQEEMPHCKIKQVNPDCFCYFGSERKVSRFIYKMKNVVRADEKGEQGKHQVPLLLWDIPRFLSKSENVNVMWEGKKGGRGKLQVSIYFLGIFIAFFTILKTYRGRMKMTGKANFWCVYTLGMFLVFSARVKTS